MDFFGKSFAASNTTDILESIKRPVAMLTSSNRKIPQNHPKDALSPHKKRQFATLCLVGIHRILNTIQKSQSKFRWEYFWKNGILLQIFCRKCTLSDETGRHQ